MKTPALRIFSPDAAPPPDAGALDAPPNSDEEIVIITMRAIHMSPDEVLRRMCNVRPAAPRPRPTRGRLV